MALVQFDMFADVVTQRSENETGVWLSGLDVVAADALALPGYYDAPPVICYLDRDIGAAIRRARTRMPGGGENPVAIIRVPRERMIGTGIASSLVHEVGHQAAALLDLVDSLRPALRRMQRDAAPAQLAWKLWERWISEIVADFWSVARVGIAATLGLIGVVSLPRAFVFRMNVERSASDALDPRQAQRGDRRGALPASAMAAAERTWERFYPPSDMTPQTHAVLDALQASMPAFVALLDQSPAAIAARPVADGGDGDRRSASRRGSPRCTGAGTRNPSDMYRTAPIAGVCRDRTGALGRNDQPRGRKHTALQAAHVLGAARHVNMSEICAASSVAPSRAA